MTPAEKQQKRDLAAATAAVLENPPAELRLIRSGKQPDLLSFQFNDSGNADRLIALQGKNLWFCSSFKKWLVWDGQRWAVDEADQATRLVKQTMFELSRQAAEANSEAAAKFANASLDARRLANALFLTRCELPIKASDLDTNPYLLNVLNGTVDLQTGELRAHDPTDLITKLVHYEYRPEAQCPQWSAFLDQIMGGGPEADEAGLERARRLTEYLQRALGYSLTGITSEKAVFVLFGDGNNGKSTLLTTFRSLVEEYATLLQVDTLMVRQESNNSQADLADLRGARFAQTSETEEGQRLAQGKLKRITQGMGKIRGMRKYENPFDFDETHKLWMDTNSKPEINVDDRATLNRLHAIPFTVRIPDDQIDRELPNKLRQEAEGILAWAVEGARLWHESGLPKPPEVAAANEEWRKESDQLGRFIEERCVVADNLRTPASRLYSAYKGWAEDSGERVMPEKSFGTKMPSRGFSKDRTKRGQVYVGIGVANQEVQGVG